MLTTTIQFLVGFITFGILDYTFLAHVAKNFYLEKLATHITVKDGALVTYLPAIPLVYITALIAISFFVLPQAKSTGSALLYGALLGFCMYAFYDLTNLATLKDYSWSVTGVDILWGTFLTAIVSLVMFLVKVALS